MYNVVEIKNYKLQITKLAPEYLHQLFTPRHTEYNLRHLEGKLALPKPHTNYLKQSFSYSGALLWNICPKKWGMLTLLGISNERP